MLWDNNLIQFARLLCEINANIDISTRDWNLLEQSMDLSTDDLNELFDRAHEVWENSKKEHVK